MPRGGPASRRFRIAVTFLAVQEPSTVTVPQATPGWQRRWSLHRAMEGLTEHRSLRGRGGSVRAGSAAEGRPTDNSGHERLPTFAEPAGRSTYSPLTSHGGDGRRGVRVSPPAAASLLGSCPQEWLTEDGPHPPVELGAVAATSEHRRSRRPCHLRAISSGQQRYPPDNHGHSERADGLAPGP